MNKKWHNLEIEEILTELDSNKLGLSSSEAKKRLDKYGLNTLPKAEKTSIFKIFISQFASAIIYIMFAACIFSFFLGEYIDAIAIILIILLDALLGTFQEYKAGKDSESLQNLIKFQSKVIRDGKVILIDSEKLVMGDIILLESGNKVSADLRIISSSNLTINESILTGESLAAVKTSDKLKENLSIVERKNIAYAGTSVSTGRATCIVIATAGETEIGKISSKVIETKSEKSPLVIRMEKLTKQISIIVLIIAIMLTVILVLKGGNINDILLSVTALSVSAIPEGLPLALTLALTIGSNRMAKKNVIVKKLNAVESLGSCTIIASDKTGTLTVNEQTAKKIVLPDGSTFHIEGTGYNDDGKVTPIDNAKIEEASEIAKLGYYNNEATLEFKNGKWQSTGDSIDIAFLSFANKLNIKKEKNIIELVPYESEKKYSAVFYEEEEERYCTVKGSIEKVISFCDKMKTSTDEIPIDKEALLKQNDLLASGGYRVIALAKGKTKEKNVDNLTNLTFYGMVAFIDPTRKEVKNSIKKCEKAGIKVVMITGDHPLTAFAIAKELNIVNNYDEVSTGDEIKEYLEKGHEAFDKFVKTKTVFSRITPIEKLEIVNSYKRQGEFVAVTGDGVNDAPAIKSANIGIAMGSGTDVAKETGTMIIVDDNFMSIVSGIEEGRNAYGNIRKVVYMLLSNGISEVLFFTLSIIFNLPMPLIAIQLLWLNIVTDGLQDIALSFEKETDNIMEEKPRSPKETVFDRLMTEETLISGISIGIIVFIFWVFLLKVFKLDVYIARGYIMLLMVFMQNIHVLNCRSEKTSAFKIPISNNIFVIFSIISALGLQIIMMEVPLFNQFLSVKAMPISNILMTAVIALPILFIMETYKKIKFKRK